MSMNEAQARLDGQMARLQRRPFSDNPHPIGTTLSRAWSKGYREIAA